MNPPTEWKAVSRTVLAAACLGACVLNPQPLPPADYDGSFATGNPDAAALAKGDARGDALSIPDEGDAGGGGGGDGGATTEGGFEGGEAGLVDAVGDATDATTEASRETGVADGAVRDGPEAGGDH